jgi:hypothetical protein
MASHRLKTVGTLLSSGRRFVVDLLIVVVVGAVPVLYAADRIIKARAQTRRLRTMTDRLAAATTRAEVQQEKRQEVAKFSAALTSVMPAIKWPPLSLPDAPSPGSPVPGEPSDAELSDAESSDDAPPDAEPSDNEPPHRTAPHGTGPHSNGPHGTARTRADRAHTGPQDHAHRRRSPRTGEHSVRSADR